MHPNVLCLWVALGSAISQLHAASAGVLKSEFIYETAPFPECHASTIVESPQGLVAAWFGGTREKHPDVGIWVARRQEGKWSAPTEVANGVQPVTGGEPRRYPCWNPVLFRAQGGRLLLFYKVGPNPDAWWGMLKTSRDDGRSWSEARRLPDGVVGPIKNKPVRLSNGDLLSPSSSEDHGWRVHFELSHDEGETWTSTPPLNDGKEIGAIQPSVLFLSQGRLLAIGRTRQHRVFEMLSEDNGRTWGKMSLGSLPNPNSGTDALTLRDGRHLIVYNHVPGEPGKWGGKRSPLNVAVSEDGRTWRAAAVLEDEPNAEFSYPAVIQSDDGIVHITYTWKRQRVRHVEIDPARLVLRDLIDGQWPRP